MEQSVEETFEVDCMKDVSFEDFESDNSNIVFLKRDGSIVDKSQMFLDMGGTLPT